MSSAGSITSLRHGSPDPPRPMSPSQSTEDILQTIMKIRKSWKTLKGNTEPVWPPHLEATMLKGLQEYGPVHSREAHTLSRFPQRNQFISDYIYRKTGKHRSTKQIGSRLQQFKDTLEGRELIDSLQFHDARSEVDLSRRFSPHSHGFEDEFNPSTSSLYSNSSTPSNDSSSTCSSTGSSISSGQYRDMSSSKRTHLPDTRTPVYIDILPESSSFSSSSSSRSRVPLSSPYRSLQGVAAHTSSGTPRPIRNIDSTVTFVSPSTVIGKSSYIVLLDGAPIHSEDTKLECVGPYFTGSSDDGPLLYSTALVPKYWETLCKSPDPTVYTIIQDVYRTLGPGIPARSSGRPRPVPIFSATYHFRYSVTPTSSISPHFAYQDNSRLLANTTHASSDLLNPIRPLSFPNYPVSPNFSEQGRLQSHEYNTQSRLDEQFISDGSLDNFPLDDFMTNFHDSHETTYSEMMAQSSSSFPTDIHNYIM
ncbi:hypothetical protein DFJ58DRAFT_744079 [Suillus subalutaceus]|uniref:uncharacterized protein n=1 Tax=Suillus subalutaceus TaxID=48586 RepID=UPI001B860D71|nr:uncharacterized protein DFJ58DRAFT_744079 [Suillus subalutaceus]KAG1862063.1 hypothetical protein DFJ58DRAFT_744079 [Suillus subalutaceus]